MSILPNRSLIIAVILLLFTLRGPVAAAQEPPPLNPRLGLVDAFVNSPEATAAGAGWSRIFLRWDVVQPAGPGDWKPANVPDTFIDAELAAGREVVAVLIGTPAWATPTGASTAVPPLEHWGNFVAQIAAQYRGRINHWVIWNQPDVLDPASPNHTWDGSEEDYFALLREAYGKIKSVDPAMQVHLAGLTYTYDSDRGAPQYLARLLSVIAADPDAAANTYYFDAVTYHLYYNPRQMVDALTEVRAILAGKGLNKPIWFNETNAPPSVDPLEPLAAPAGVSITLEEQQAFVIQAFALALAGGAERVAFHKLRNTADHPESMEPHGLLRADNSRRPAFTAFQAAARHFAGVQAAVWQNVGNVTAVTLTRDHQTTTVLWNNGSAPVQFSLPAIASQGLLVDVQGQELPVIPANGFYAVDLPAAVCSNGPNCFIGGSPRLVVETGAPEQRPALAQPQPTAQATLPPTDTPASPTPTPPPPPTLTPLPTPLEPPTPIGDAVGAALPSPAAPAPVANPPAALPDSGPAPLAEDAAPAVAPTVVPPVSFSTVMTPNRWLWLFVVGLIVFTVSYGVQVVIWYRLKR
jgi:hypothetical protein